MQSPKLTVKVFSLKNRLQKREYIERMRQQEGGAVDPSIFETQEANAAILQNIATRRALQAQMAHHYMNVSEADAINVIKNADAFKKDGQFSPELYENYPCRPRQERPAVCL